MKGLLKVTLGVLAILILVIIVDLMWITIFKRPIFAVKEDNGDSVNMIYKGVFYDTYMCHEYTKPKIHLKGTKLTCTPKLSTYKIEDKNFIIEESNSLVNKKTFAFTYNDIDYYYENTEFKIYIEENSNRYDLKTALENNLIKFNNILEKSIETITFRDGGSKLYHFEYFNVIVCNTVDGNKDIIIGNKDMKINNYCTNDTEYKKATETVLELQNRITLKSSMEENGAYINGNKEPISYEVYIKDKKLYAKNMNTKVEKVVFDKEKVKNIAVRTICCTGDGNLLILTENGNVYMSKENSNYFFTFDMEYTKLNAKDIVSFKLIPSSDIDFSKNLYGVDSEGKEILLHKIN